MPTDHRTNSVRPAAAVKRPPLLGKSGGGCCLLQLDPHYSSSRYLPMMADEGTYVCKAFSPRSYVIQKVVVVPFCSGSVRGWLLLLPQRSGRSIIRGGRLLMLRAQQHSWPWMRRELPCLDDVFHARQQSHWSAKSHPDVKVLEAYSTFSVIRLFAPQSGYQRALTLYRKCCIATALWQLHFPLGQTLMKLGAWLTTHP